MRGDQQPARGALPTCHRSRRPGPEPFGHCQCGIDFGYLYDHGMSWRRDDTMFAVVVEPVAGVYRALAEAEPAGTVV